MNPFVNTEFWLSLAFFVVLGFMFIPPVQRAIKKFFDAGRQKIEKQIQESKAVYQEAMQERKAALKKLNQKADDKETKSKIKQIHQEFLQKEKNSIEVKKQDFYVRKSILLLQGKENVKKQLLDKVEEKVLNQRRTKTSDAQDVGHFIKMLDKNKEKLKSILS
ncbi:MAG: hypothetical protein IKQ99_02465 [Alphaproteobacteria bacterium]|nr:hypothetical protein [Alphaproteobacteria bacterium]